MNLRRIFERAGRKVVHVGLVGVGEFGASLAERARKIEQMRLVAFCDRDVARVTAEVRAAGLDPAATLVTDDAQKVLDCGIDVLVEATGDAEAGARHAIAALENGIDVVMVTKQTDSVVGPYLADLARRNGRVYTAVEGDQPALLMGLISWARVLGLEIACAGKSSEYDTVYDLSTHEVTFRGQTMLRADLGALWTLGGDVAATLRARGEALASVPVRRAADYCEMCIVANGTGFTPDVPEFHMPFARTIELPDIFRPHTEGGVLEAQGRIDIFHCLRRPDEASFAGGVFIVATGFGKKTGELLRGKGIPVDRSGRYALLYNPSHLLGLEAPMTILSAGLLREASGDLTPRPVCDVVARTVKPLAAGTILELGERHAVAGIEPLLVPSVRAQGSNPAPFYLADGLRLKKDVVAGATITIDALDVPADSVLARLRARQDETVYPSGPVTFSSAAHIASP